MQTLVNIIYTDFLPLIVTLVFLYFFQVITFTHISKLVPYWVFRLFAAPGVILHELSHALIAVLSFHKIIEISFFNTNGSDAMGYVTHSYNPTSLYQRCGNLFIGIAPAFAGVGALFFIYNYFGLLPQNEHLDFIVYCKSILKNLIDMPLIDSFICVYLSSSIATTMSPSKADYKGAIGGIIVILILLFTGNILAPTFIAKGLLNINHSMIVFSSYTHQSLVVAIITILFLFFPIFLFKKILTKIKN